MKKNRPRARKPKPKRSRPTALVEVTGYYHGGRPGLPIGSFILPAREIGSVQEGLLEHLIDAGRPEAYNPDYAYVTSDLDWGALYASYHRSLRGVVYEVEPDGELIPDPDEDCVGHSFMCARARILRVVRYPFRIMHALRERNRRGEGTIMSDWYWAREMRGAV